MLSDAAALVEASTETPHYVAGHEDVSFDGKPVWNASVKVKIEVAEYTKEYSQPSSR